MKRLIKSHQATLNQVARQILRAASILIASAALSLMIFAGGAEVHAVVKGWTPPVEGPLLSQEANGDNPLRIVIEPSQSNLNMSDETPQEERKMDNYPDLGSDQVFPFIAGLDSFE